MDSEIKTVEGYLWDVTIIKSGVRFVSGCRTRREAVQEAKDIVKVLIDKYKDDIDQRMLFLLNFKYDQACKSWGC